MTNSDLALLRIATLLLILATPVGGRGAEALADESAIPGLGSRVRVASSGLPSRPLVGTLTAVEAKSLAVQAKDRSEVVVLARQAMVGAILALGERWAEVPLDRIRAGGPRGERGSRVRLSLVATGGSRRGLTLVTSF